MSAQILLKYYGIDWLAMVFTVLSICYLGEKKRIGFVYGLLANVCWFIFGVLAVSIANPVANTIFLVLNIRGYLNWRREASPPPD